MYQGPLSGLTTGAGRVRVAVTETESAEQVFRAMGWIHRRDGDVLLIDGIPAREVNRALAERGIYAHNIADEGRKLEDVFLELTEGPSDA